MSTKPLLKSQGGRTNPPKTQDTPPKPSIVDPAFFYNRLRRVVRGAVVDTMKQHPEYFSGDNVVILNSLSKRIIGQLLSSAVTPAVCNRAEKRDG